MRCSIGWGRGVNGWRRSPSTAPLKRWCRRASCTASKAATPSLPAMPATRCGSWCWPAIPAAAWPRPTRTRCLRQSTAAPSARALQPRARSWRGEACVRAARRNAGSRRMHAPSAQEALARPGHADSPARDPDDQHDAEQLSPAPAADALFSARSLWLTRAGRVILQGVDIDMAEGEILTLIGPNGAGKTTLVRLLLGLEKP